MKIDLKFMGTELYAIVAICVKEKGVKNFSFILSNSFIIEKVLCNNKKAVFKKTGETQPTFSVLSQNIQISSDDDICEIVIEYSGHISGWHNVITDELRALSSYSVWYPQESSVKMEFGKVNVHDCSDYLVVKGIYDENTKVWEYSGFGYDPYNIIAYKKSSLKSVSSQYLNVYCLDDNVKSVAKEMDVLYRDVLDYYNGELFDKRDILLLDIASLAPAYTRGGGAYKRKGLIVCDTLLNKSKNDLLYMLAHELAHEWCTGANSASWEDWLNETTAEWSALLYVISKNDMDLFHSMLKPKLEGYSSLPAIKTVDGSRPEGVHDKGTVLFYEIYQKYGLEIVRKLVQLFVRLEMKTTAKFLEEIKSQISPDIALYIEKGIEQ